MLHTQLKDHMREALKAHEEVKLTTLRGLLGAITNELVTLKQKPSEVLDDVHVLAVIKRATKQRKDSIEQFTKGDRPDLVLREQEELTILEKYVPALASEEEITAVAQRIISEIDNLDPLKSGVIVGAVMRELKGNADGTQVQEIVSHILAT